jgi:hypothetical protein
MSPNRFAFAAAVLLSTAQARAQTPSPQSAERVAMPVAAAQAPQFYIPYVPAKPSTNHAITFKPGPVLKGVASLGRFLAKADRTHVWQWQHHRLIPVNPPSPAGLVPMPAPLAAAPRASAQAPPPPAVTSDGVPILRIPDPIADAVPGPNDVREVR